MELENIYTSGDWCAIAESLKPSDKGTEGEERYLGLGGWCKYTYIESYGWYLNTTEVSDFTEIFEAYR